MEITKFDELELNPNILRAVEEMGFEEVIEVIEYLQNKHPKLFHK